MILLQRWYKGDTGPHSIAADKRKTCWQAPGTSWNTDLHFKQPSEEVSCKATTWQGASSVGVEGLRRVGGEIPSQPPSTVWLSSSLPQTLLSFHKLFTSGYTKGNSVALIVAEGKFIKTLGPVCIHCSATAANLCKPYLQYIYCMWSICMALYIKLSFANYAGKFRVTSQFYGKLSFSSSLADLLGSWHVNSKKPGVSPHQSVQMASQKLRKTSTVSWKNMNQYILTRIKCASDEPFGPPKTVFLLLSNLFIFVCPHVMIRYLMTQVFFFLGGGSLLATKCNSYGHSCLTVSPFDIPRLTMKMGL